ncbi:MAG: hypothetical protein KC994_23295 [Candidatus Omnitrophica bacterium]|nr:hypothetical protein [Candidatus Omnitrophota bacterium]
MIFRKKTLDSQDCALLYLSLPYLLFFWGWLWLPYALLATVALLIGLASAILGGRSEAREDGPRAWGSWRRVLFVAVIALVWVALSGIGGVGFQNPDYPKHNAVLKDLIEKNWPVLYGEGEGARALVYYIAYYLPAAGVGKLLGWKAANACLFLWSTLGVFLFLLSLGKIIRRPIWLLVPAFILLSGLDYVGFLLFLGRSVDGTTHLEWWMRLDELKEPTRVWQYSSNTTLLFWVPQMCIGGWLLTTSLLSETLVAKSSRNLIFLMALSVLWSPFLTIGLIPFVVASLFQNRMKSLVSLQNLIAAPVLLLLAFFFYRTRSGYENWTWIWEVDHLQKFWTSYFLFLMLEFGAYAFFLKQRIAGIEPDTRPWFWTAVASLAFFPLYSSGGSNDFAMRVAIVPLLVFWIFALETLLSWEHPTQRLTARILALLLAIGAITPLTEISRALWYESSGIPDYEKVQSVEDLSLSVQYLGRSEDFFFRTLSRDAN